MNNSTEMKNKIDFQFPFQPYPIQVEFMQSLYDAIDQSKIAIFESPTGTGKSLSLICGALTWLQNYKKKQLQDMEEAMKMDNADENKSCPEDDWFEAFSKTKGKDEELKKIKKKYNYLKKREEKLNKLKEQKTSKMPKKIASVDPEFSELFKDDEELLHEINSGHHEPEDEDADLILQEYYSDEESSEKMKNLDSDVDDDDEDMDIKIYYCSRTHSQLSQFIHEIQKSPFRDNVHVVPLGSRQTMCINESVLKLKSLALINECCLSMNNDKGKKTKNSENGTIVKKKKTSKKCQFYKHTNIERTSDDLLIDVQDIEQLVTVGKTNKACPYYSSRRAAISAEVIVLPYNTLLHKSTRIACGIKLKGNVVIIDEAHNLIDTICNIYSIKITGQQLLQAHFQITQYRDRYKNRFSPKNLLYINQLINLVQVFILQIGGSLTSTNNVKIEKLEVKVLETKEFYLSSGIYNFNLFKLLSFCKQSDIAKKLQGFVAKKNFLSKNDECKQKNVSTVSSFLKQISSKNQTETLSTEKELVEEKTNASSTFPHVIEFIQALTNDNKDGRIVLNKEVCIEKSSLKYLLLNPSVEFKDIASEVRSVIVAGGTMQPVSEFSEHLFLKCGVPRNRLTFFSCGHIIPNDHVLPLVLQNGPTNKQMEFSFKNRNNLEMIDELGRLLCNLCNIIPGGIVLFFVSYEYERLVNSHWEKTNVLSKISLKKRIFREPKTASMVDSILSQYSKTVESMPQNSLTGAILFSVVGGKMSEGINFSDNLGRCIIMVGLPYPNIMSPELQEKMNFLSSTGVITDGQLPGQLYYENLCMKAVNQSIGRAIRHKDDYAAILLIDVRYSNSNVINKLPGWIKSQVQVHSKFGSAFGAINKFFISKKKSNIEVKCK